GNNQIVLSAAQIMVRSGLTLLSVTMIGSILVGAQSTVAASGSHGATVGSTAGAMAVAVPGSMETSELAMSGAPLALPTSSRPISWFWALSRSRPAAAPIVG